MTRAHLLAEPPTVDVHGPRHSEHFTHLWPTPPGSPAEAPLFLAAVSPLRAAALAVLWATSSPGRFAAVLGVVLALVAVLVVVL